jgi:hypothetical protein
MALSAASPTRASIKAERQPIAAGEPGEPLQLAHEEWERMHDDIDGAIKYVKAIIMATTGAELAISRHKRRVDPRNVSCTLW